MANVTLTIDEDLLRRARIRALEQGTSVNALVREYLDEYVGADRSREALRRFRERAERSTAASGGRRASRDELYAERLDRYGGG